MNQIHNLTLIATAIGATIGVISAASMFIYQRVYKNQKHANMNTSLEAINKRINELQAELEALRLQQSQQKRRKRSARHRVTSPDDTLTADDTDIDAFSTTGTDFDDEFYDCSDSEGGADDIEIRPTEAVINLDLILAAIDQQFKDKESAEDMYYQLQKLIEAYPNNIDIVWRYARACYYYSKNFVSDAESIKEILQGGLCASERLLETRNADLYKWYAVLTGTYGDCLPTPERIKNGTRFKELVLMALKLRSDDPSLHYLLGRFKYEVSRLSWLERKIAATLFSEPPSATYEDAIESFEQAENHATTPNMENRLFLSKAYIAVNQIPKAITCLEKISKMTAVDQEEKVMQEEAHELLNKYQGYHL